MFVWLAIGAVLVTLGDLAGAGLTPMLTDAVTIRGGTYADTHDTGTVLVTKASSTPSLARRTLFKFDTSSSLPAGTSIARATLRLTLHANDSAPFERVGAYWVNKSFIGAQATWNSYRTALPWTTPGGDFGALYATTDVSNVNGSTVAFDLTTMVQDAVNNRYGTRFTRVGLVDVGAGGSGAYRDYYGPTAANVSQRPQLIVTSGHRSPIRTVFVIVMENTNWATLKKSGSAPYIMNTLLPGASHAEQYYNPPGIHPSEPNYLWMEAGTGFGIKNDGLPSANHQSTTNHFVRQLTDAGISWTSYQEDISGTTCPLTATGLYAPKHNPMVFFNDVTNTNSSSSPFCIAHVRPYSELETALAQNSVSRYNFITPNLCHDMHDCGTAAGDMWLSTELPKIMASQAYKTGGAIFLTWDEGEDGSDGPIGMIVASPFAKGGGYQNTIRYTHSSLLRTLQEIYAMTPFLGDAANATDLKDLFRTF